MYIIYTYIYTNIYFSFTKKYDPIHQNIYIYVNMSLYHKKLYLYNPQ